jgi:polysaccharide export outer membrane protein
MNSTADKRRNFGVREDADSWARWWRRPAAPIAWRRLVGFLLLILLNVSVAGCDSVSALGPINRSAAHPTAVARTAGRLQVGDKIKIVVVGEEKISGDYEIDPEGSISVPVAGTMRVAGLTKSELERQLAQKLRSAQYLRDAMVTVDIAAFRPFYVLGEVEKPGEYPYHAGLGVVSAVAVAGGYTYRANKSYVLVQRAGEHEFTEYSLPLNVQIYPGDVINVPERYF